MKLLYLCSSFSISLSSIYFCVHTVVFCVRLLGQACCLCLQVGHVRGVWSMPYQQAWTGERHGQTGPKPSGQSKLHSFHQNKVEYKYVHHLLCFFEIIIHWNSPYCLLKGTHSGDEYTCLFHDGLLLQTPENGSVTHRIHKDLRRTVDLCQKAESAGVSWITVHGRTADERHQPVHYDAIKTIKDSISVPVIANGDIKYLRDVESVHQLTGVDGRFAFSIMFL